MRHEIDPYNPDTWPASARKFLARREPTPDERVVRRNLGAWVAARGRVSWAALMERALYAPASGYYRRTREPIGPEGDFVTSPELHPAFGACVARWMAARWREMCEPRTFPVVEAGGGTGAAAAQILQTAAAQPAFADALEYVLLEPGAGAARRQRERLGIDRALRWVSNWHNLPSICGVIWANELLDALPVHRVVREGEALREIWVRWEETGTGGRFVEEPGALSTPALAGYFQALGLQPPEGVAVDVNLAAGEWLRAAAERLERGFLLLFDYGGTAEELYGDPRSAGTLRAYRRHALLPDPLEAIGVADLTADVEFTSLMAVARAAGLQVRRYSDQRGFLRRHGIDEWLRRPPEPGTPGHLRLLELLDPAGLGRVRVLELAKG
jgi:SAM-dependent MidA family methyltransferase